MTSPWTSLEIVKVAISAVTPLAVLGLGVMLASRTRKVDDVRWANQLIVQRRVELFGAVAPRLNALLCFATFVGRWKELTPAAVLAVKRDLDETVHTNRLLFSPAVFATYNAFMTTCFQIYANVDKDALLRLPVASKWGDRRNLQWWTDELHKMFVPEAEAVATEAVQQSYGALQAALRADLYVTTASALLR